MEDEARQGWVYLFVDAVFVVLVTATLSHQSPELIEERETAAKKAKSRDKVIVPVVILILPFFLFVFAGLDRRWHWTSITVFESLVALPVLIASNTLVFWALKTNAFFSSFARIQDDRGHRVVSSGPYHHVRHPGYLGLIAGSLALPVLLGSLPALLIGGVISLLYVVRTELEDRMLRAELENYGEYAAKVRYKLVPFLW